LLEANKGDGVKQNGQQQNRQDEHHSPHGGGAHFHRVMAWLFYANQFTDFEVTQNAQQGSSPDDGHHKREASQA